MWPVMKVDFVPAHGPQLRGAHEGQHSETQRQSCSRCVIVTIQAATIINDIGAT
jgi:hypothetical protein